MTVRNTRPHSWYQISRYFIAAKSLLYSSGLSCPYCVCTHSLERNPILRSNPQAEQSKRALLYSAEPSWGGWGDFIAPHLPLHCLRGQCQVRTGRSGHDVYKLVKIHTRAQHSVIFQGHGGKVAAGRCGNFDELAFVVCSAENTWGHTRYAWYMQTRTNAPAHTYFKAYGKTDWSALHASSIIPSACKRYVLLFIFLGVGVFGLGAWGVGWGLLLPKHFAVISCDVRDTAQLNGRQNCSGEHYLREGVSLAGRQGY